MNRARPDLPSTPAGATTPRGTPPRIAPPRTQRSRNGDTDVLQFDIPSDLDHGRTVQETILEACRHARFEDDAFFAVKLALDEAVTNAIKHGNRLDPFKRVRVTANISAQGAEIEITDEGPGFDRSKVPDPTIDENIDKCSGRGLLLIEAYMTKVSWSADGRSIRMQKLNSTEPPQAHRH